MYWRNVRNFRSVASLHTQGLTKYKFLGVITMTFPISIIITNFRDSYRNATRAAALNKQRFFDETLTREHFEDVVLSPQHKNSALGSAIVDDSSDDD